MRSGASGKIGFSCDFLVVMRLFDNIRACDRKTCACDLRFSMASGYVASLRGRRLCWGVCLVASGRGDAVVVECVARGSPVGMRQLRDGVLERCRVRHIFLDGLCLGFVECWRAWCVVRRVRALVFRRQALACAWAVRSSSRGRAGGLFLSYDCLPRSKSGMPQPVAGLGGDVGKGMRWDLVGL